MKKLAVILFALILATTSHAEDRLKIVTTLSTYADIAKTVAGVHADTSFIASPRFNPHFIEAKPSDVFKLKKADLFIHSGLDLEAWRGPLLDAAARSDLREGGARQLDLSIGISLLEVPQGQVSRAEGDIHQFGNPHYWTNPRNGKIIARSIADKLKELDPVHAQEYQRNVEQFLARLDESISRWSTALSPLKGSEVVGYHNEWIYLMDFSGLKMDRFVETKPGIPPTPRHLEELEAVIGQKRMKVLVQASFYPKDATEFLASHTGIRPVTICQNVGELPQCADYISMIDFAVNELIKGNA